jgi:hypothetical protein
MTAWFARIATLLLLAFPIFLSSLLLLLISILLMTATLLLLIAFQFFLFLSVHFESSSYISPKEQMHSWTVKFPVKLESPTLAVPSFAPKSSNRRLLDPSAPGTERTSP